MMFKHKKVLKILKEEPKMIKDINGREILRGCIIVDKLNHFRRVIEITTYKILATDLSINLKDAKNSDRSGVSWNQQEISRQGFEIVEYRSLGVYDSTGREYKEKDIINVNGKGHEVFMAVSSRENYFGGSALIYLDTCSCDSWSVVRPSNSKILHSAIEEPKRKITIEEKGKTILTSMEPLSIETAKRLGIVK